MYESARELIIVNAEIMAVNLIWQFDSVTTSTIYCMCQGLNIDFSVGVYKPLMCTVCWSDALADNKTSVGVQ